MTDSDKVTTRLLEKAGRKKPAVYGVFKGMDLVGLVEQYKSHGNPHPWKAYSAEEAGSPDQVVFLGAFYVGDGGKERAIQVILGHHDALSRGEPSPFVRSPRVPVSPGQIGGLG